ncbi:MAG TPA: Maf family protein [Solirubrobacteraceae bacterium]|jgi:septum formation protein|nr:Maf family protein [Solirubrobacteraceae bacterium]
MSGDQQSGRVPGGAQPAPPASAKLVLASASPQRRAILERLGVSFEVRPSGAHEREQGDPAEISVANALAKARAVARAGETVIGCDTVVALDGAIYGKPPDGAAARRTLRALSGRTHEVVSGLAVLSDGAERTAIARSAVTFRELPPALLDWYVALGEWRERAGGYAIQGAGAALVTEVRGGFQNVVGLPLPELLDICPGLLGGA